MASYDYKCPNEHTTTIHLPIAEDKPAEVPCDCGTGARRVFHAAPIHFDGLGYYSTGG